MNRQTSEEMHAFLHGGEAAVLIDGIMHVAFAAVKGVRPTWHLADLTFTAVTLLAEAACRMVEESTTGDSTRAVLKMLGEQIAASAGDGK